MPSYKLYYFNGKARAELIRFIFAAADVPYEDVRFSQEEWPAHKSKMPFGQIPVLEVDGKHIGQSIAIAHFVAREFHLAGKTNIDDANCLAFAEQMKDLLDGCVIFRFVEKDEARKAELKKAFEDGALKRGLTALEHYVTEHASSAGYIIGDELSWADLAVYSGVELLQIYLDNHDLLAEYPKLKAHYHAIGHLPRIKAYLEKRPETQW